VSFVDESVNSLQGNVINPNFPAGGTNFRGYVVEEVKLVTPFLLVRNSGGAELSAAHGAGRFSVLHFSLHGLLSFLSLGFWGFLVHGSSHLRGSSQWIVMM
jgi:hypothetical protein